MIVSGAVEGPVDDAVVRRMLRETGHDVGPIHIKSGKAPLLDRLQGHNAAARLAPWLVLVDLDADAPCAPPFVARHLAAPSDQMLFRVAVRQVESWLLADKRHIARFLRVSQAMVSGDPDSLDHSKRALVEIAKRSTDRSIRQELVPQAGSGRQVGPGYVARMIEFVELHWRLDEAAARSESLRRCLDRLRAL